MEKCFIICRQSSGTTDPEESLSLEVQEAECRKFASSKGIDVVDCFKEGGTSGRLYPVGYEQMAAQDWVYTHWCEETKKSGQYRAGLGSVLQRLSEVTYVVAYDSTRLFRPLNGSFLSALISQAFQAKGVKLLTLKEGIIDFGKFQDALVTTLTSQINSEQLSIQREKAKAALKKLKDNGTYKSGLDKLFGYKKGNSKYEIVIDEKQAEAVKAAYRLFNNAWNITKITIWLNQHYRDVNKQPFSKWLVSRILQYPQYAGYVFDSNGELIKAKQLEGKELIPLDTWMTAWRKFESRRATGMKAKKHWLPLSSFCYCGQCGYKMISAGGAGGKKQYYICLRTYREGTQPCRNNLTITNDLKYGLGLIETIKPLLLAEAMKQMKSSRDSSEDRRRLAEVDVAMAELKRKAEKLTEMWVGGIMDESIYEKAMKDVKEKEKELTKKRTDIELELSKDVTAFEWAKLMMKFKGDALPQGEYEMLANLMLKKILIYRDFIEVKTTYGDVTIPRQRLSFYSLCFNYVLQMKAGKAAVYYYKGKANSKPASSRAYFCAAVFGDLTVYIEK